MAPPRGGVFLCLPLLYFIDVERSRAIADHDRRRKLAGLYPFVDGLPRYADPLGNVLHPDHVAHRLPIITVVLCFRHWPCPWLLCGTVPIPTLPIPPPHPPRGGGFFVIAIRVGITTLLSQSSQHRPSAIGSALLPKRHVPLAL